MNTANASVGLKAPAASLAERFPPRSSRDHACSHTVVAEDDHRRVVGLESHVDIKCAITLDADPEVMDIKEQVRIDWPDAGRVRKHYFDFVVTMRSGVKTALIVKPDWHARASKFLQETKSIAEHAVGIGFVDEVRVLTDECIDDTQFRNAQLIRNARGKDDEADVAALSVVAMLVGAVPLSDLVSRIGLEARGFRALVRLIAKGRLECLHHEVISPSSLVKEGLNNEHDGF